ncbi:beta-lactamase family protein [Microbacterium sp. W1N]|uniref:serine hydrolase domain-containing protein n=1 Tax=Microbacterium festucae TaxID=2977531 RepID=UPI0021BF3212|nr:serine hydrolase domain-containing protein [Microbacterium festucae]MCT9819787.1 beta-lactamase family protein [Microbacterium festucae]
MAAPAFAWVDAHVRAGRLPSAVLGIATAEGTVALEGFGADPRDEFALFSITKLLTGITAARLIERGAFTLDTPLAEALPAFGTGRDDIVRLRHLASHTSGIAEPPLDTAVPLRTELLTRPRDFPAGRLVRYSSLAFEGIAAMITHATGRPWDAELHDWARPLGATGLTLDPMRAAPVVDAAAAGLDLARFATTRAPGAGLAGRADDLLRLGTELLRIHAGARDGILAPATLAMMRRPLTAGLPHLDTYPGTGDHDWGFTLKLRTRAAGLIDDDVYGHAGWAGTEFWVHPSAGVAWVLLTHRAMRPGVDPDQLHNLISTAARR